MPLFPCDPQALINSAVCFDKCIPPGAQREVALYLLCQWAQVASVPTPPTPPPPPPAFSYEPVGAVIQWTDKNAVGQTGILSYFNAHADISSVSSISYSLGYFNSFSNLSSLPSLTSFIFNGQSLGNGLIDFTGCSALQHVESNNGVLITPTIVGCPNLTYIDFSTNNLISPTVNSLLATFVANGKLNGHFDTSGQGEGFNPSPPAPPTGQGIIDAGTLQARGWTVTTE